MAIARGIKSVDFKESLKLWFEGVLKVAILKRLKKWRFYVFKVAIARDINSVDFKES